MAIPILNHMDFQKSAEIRNVLLHATNTAGVSSPGTGQIIYDSGSVKYYNGSAWLTLASGGGTRAVAVDTNGDGSVNNTLELSEDLVLKKGTGVTLSEAGGVVTISANSTLTQEQVEDYVGGMLDGEETGMSVGYDDTNGNLDFVIAAAQTTITSILNTSLVVGRDAHNQIDFSTDNEIKFKTNNETPVIIMKAGGEIEATQLDISGDIDVDGISSLDNTDIDGTLVVDGSIISLDSTSTLNIDNSNTSNGITIGTATSGVPISIGHTTSEVTVNDNLTVTGNFTVTGTTTTLNETVKVVENNTIEFEGTTADAHEIKLTGGEPTADRTVALPDASGTIALTSNSHFQVTKLLSGDGSTTAFVISHGLGSNIVSTKVLDYGNAGSGATYEEVIVETKAGVDNNKVALTFASAPSGTQDYLVLVTKFPAAS